VKIVARLMGLAAVLGSSFPAPVVGQIACGADFSQADRMVRLLEQVEAGGVSDALVDSFMSEHGTELIIEQQNISRTVTAHQYRQVLESLSEREPPALQPADDGVRARRGLEGLLEDVRPSMLWGMRHRDLLARRVEELRGRDLRSSAIGTARTYLPEEVPLAPCLFVVMGGRAGAAALEDGEIYFDVLATSFRETTGALGPYPSTDEVSDYYAHEVHHLGLSAIIDRARDSLQLSDAEERVFEFLRAIVLEGSASYFITGHGSLAMLEGDPQFARLSKGDSLLETAQQILITLSGEQLEEAAYDSVMAPMLGTGWHSAGALILHAIDRAGGFPAVAPVLVDPRKLLVAYNAAQVDLGHGGWMFDAALAERVQNLGH
jgi:hypothetical protein